MRTPRWTDGVSSRPVADLAFREAGDRDAPVALLLAMGLYLVAVVGLFALAVTLRPEHGEVGTLEPAGVGGGVLGVVLVWSAALVTVHVRHDRGPLRSRS